jgi:hypothetical protein
MSGVTAIDHALPNGNNNAASADPGGMTNDEKLAVGGILRTDEARGAAVHVSRVFFAVQAITINRDWCSTSKCSRGKSYPRSKQLPLVHHAECISPIQRDNHGRTISHPPLRSGHQEEITLIPRHLTQMLLPNRKQLQQEKLERH